MKKLLIPLSLALAQVFAVSAFAQSKGEADPAQSRAVPAAKATAQEKAAAKASRQQTAKVVAKASKAEGPAPAGVAKQTTKEQRVAAAAKRKADAAEAVKKGQVPSGEK